MSVIQVLTEGRAPWTRALRDACMLETATTSLGQHFLKNPAVVTAIVAKAAIKPTDSV